MMLYSDVWGDLQQKKETSQISKKPLLWCKKSLNIEIKKGTTPNPANSTDLAKSR